MLTPLLAVAGLLIPAAPAVAQDPCSVVKTGTPRIAAGAPRPPLVVGDSTNLLAVDPLVKLGIEADARGCRQIGPAVDILAARRHAGTLPRVVVLAVGANGAVPRSELRRALNVAGPHRMLGLVTTPVPASSAQAMRDFHARHPTRTILIDWGGSGIPQRYGGDGLHIGYAGEARLARFIYRRVHPYTPPRHPIVLPADPATAKACGTVVRDGHRLAVYVVRGPQRIVCTAARALVRTPDPETLPTFNWFDWRFVGRPPWTDVFARHDGKVIVAARPPAPTPAPGTGPPAP
ncbi:MAG: yrhL [Solirubrobacteraceae bacterium]|nr:yrhL [Solirubrobacteraceae bacterium]